MESFTPKIHPKLTQEGLQLSALFISFGPISSSELNQITLDRSKINKFVVKEDLSPLNMVLVYRSYH